MTLDEYTKFSADLAQKAGVENGLHHYFLLHQTRLWRTASHFNLWNLTGKKTLEIGPFFSYTPFVLKQQLNDVVVVEGDDPAVYPLRALYQAQGIEFITCDLFESFGSPPLKKHRLPFADNLFDCVSSWETMEHFNFNPVGFVRDLRRILKPGGEAFITVPNMATLRNRVKLLAGQGIAAPVETYNQYYEYADGKFMGFHWREYVMSELIALFEQQNFSIVSQGYLMSFQHHAHLPFSRKIKRMIGKSIYSVWPSMSNICAIVARKPL